MLGLDELDYLELMFSETNAIIEGESSSTKAEGFLMDTKGDVETEAVENADPEDNYSSLPLTQPTQTEAIAILDRQSQGYLIGMFIHWIAYQESTSIYKIHISSSHFTVPSGREV